MHGGRTGITRAARSCERDRVTAFPYQNFKLDPRPLPRAASAELARAVRQGIEVRRKRRHLLRRALVLLAAVAVPALAAPGEWGLFEVGDAGRSEAAIEPMPFERAGDSFPGSAFYYLASAAEERRMAGGLSVFDLIHSDADPAPARIDPLGGPVARALRIDNSGIDRTRALQCLTAAIYYEARSEPDDGQRAVAQVVLNRVAHKAYPDTVCGVVYQGSERSTGCQFSFTCDGSLARVPQRFFWQRAENVALAALAGSVFTPVGLATHYHTFAVNPYWNAKMLNVVNIGAHRFFRMPGLGGQPGAFRFAYAGGEPIAAPHARDPAADRRPDPALDPLELERAYEAGLKAAQANAGTVTAAMVSPLVAAPPRLGQPARLAPAPAYAHDQQQRGGDALFRGERLPQATGVNPEYRDSGRWIAQPGT